MDYSAYDVVLLPTFIQVEAYRKRRASADACGVFAQTATTFNAWIADLWELYGDGRRLVDSVERATLMRIAYSRVSQARGAQDTEGPVAGKPASGRISEDGRESREALTVSPGVARLAERCEMQAAGIDAYDAAVEAAEQGRPFAGLSLREMLFLRGIAQYRQLLGTFDLVELGEACRVLAENAADVFPRPLQVLLQNAAPLDWRASRFFSMCPQLHLSVNMAPGADGVRLPPDGVELRLAYPAGRYAIPGALMQLVGELAPGERTVVCCADPLALYRQLEPALAGAGLVGGVQAQMRFCDTDFGRAYLLALQVVNDEAWAPSWLADMLHAPYAGFTPAQAREYDARLRADRIAQRETCLAELCGKSDDFAALVALAKRGADAAELERFERLVDAQSNRSPEWRAQEHGAINCLRSIQRYAAVLGAGWRERAEVLAGIGVTVSAIGATSDGASKPDVLFTTQGAASQLDEGSFALLVASDLTADAYPIAEKDDAASTLFAKLGLEPADDALSRARRTFTALMRVPSRAFVCMRPQNDADGNPAYPCAMLEELIDAYRAANAEAFDVQGDDEELPDGLAASLLQRGEDALYANALAAPVGARQPVAARVELPAPGSLASPAPGETMLLPRRFGAGAGVLKRSPSPSQVESYLECPYKWFVQSRLRIARLEEEFDALGRGTFAHEVLERFYRAFADAGHPKVTASNLSAARAMLYEVAQAVRAEMRNRQPGEGRWVAANKLEEREIDQLVEQLGDFLDYDTEILPGFHPQYLEYEFGADSGIKYAGCPMVGKVDRIDVDDAGHAVIIDYKGSVKPVHDIAGKTTANPGKVQTRIYAQMVKRKLGLDVVGSLYVSYGKVHKMAGAADARVLESAHLPGSSAGGIWCALGAPEQDSEVETLAELPFSQMLDATEELVAQAVVRMEAGDIAPAPSAPEACEHCPVASCPQRLKRGK